MIISSKQYMQVGNYDIKFKYTSDHDLTLRLVKIFPGKNNNFTLVKKMDGGVTHIFKYQVLKEFRDILKKNGLPFYFANIVFYLKTINFYLKHFFYKI